MSPNPWVEPAPFVRVRVHPTPQDLSYLKQIVRGLGELDEGFLMVEPLAAQGRLFPGGEWNLADLQRRIEQGGLDTAAGMDVVVIIMEPYRKEETFYVDKSDSYYYIDARVVDLAGFPGQWLTTRASEKSRVVEKVLPVDLVPEVEASAIRGVSASLAYEIRRARPVGPVRVGVLALEYPAQQYALEGYAKFTPAAPPPRGQALVYIYRPADPVRGNDSLSVYTGPPDSPRYLTRLLGQSYFPLYTLPGQLRLGASGAGAKSDGSPLQLTVAAGATYYVRSTVAGGESMPAVELDLADPAEAEAALVDCHLMPTAREYDLETRRRAELGNGYSQVLMRELYKTGVSYADGTDLPRDLEEAERWSRRSGRP